MWALVKADSSSKNSSMLPSSFREVAARKELVNLAQFRFVNFKVARGFTFAASGPRAEVDACVGRGVGTDVERAAADLLLERLLGAPRFAGTLCRPYVALLLGMDCSRASPASKRGPAKMMLKFFDDLLSSVCSTPMSSSKDSSTYTAFRMVTNSKQAFLCHLRPSGSKASTRMRCSMMSSHG